MFCDREKASPKLWFSNSFIAFRGGRPQEDEFWTLRGTMLRRDFTILGFSPQLVIIREKQTINAHQACDYKNTE
ncbi:MAG: hypothetical protein OXC82_01395 [Rhodobacteraceae bacterium]|nr:hypothetical protein [Paracoccaceae bacterium]MCY4249082.1 hypothetical protein [Paracoccaceae bacterium]